MAHVLWVSSWECFESFRIDQASLENPNGMNDRSQYSTGLYNKTLNLPPFRQANGNCCDDYNEQCCEKCGSPWPQVLEGWRQGAWRENDMIWWTGSCSDTGVGFMVPSPILEEKQRNVCGTAVQPPMHRPGYTCDEWIHHDPAKNSCEFMKRERVTE